MTAPATLDHQLLVATCIGCGARSRPGACEDGCDDVPLDLVDAAGVDAQRRRREALRARVAALRAIAESLASDGSRGWDRLREQAREALLVPLPAAVEEPVIVEAWGCPRCGRVDAPQPCLGICIRRPVAMSDAREYRDVAEEADALAVVESRLAALTRLVAHTTPRPGRVEATRAALREHALAALRPKEDA